MKRRRQIPSQDKANILKRHLVDKVPVSDLCDEYGIQPSALYTWQRKLFENAAVALESQGRAKRQQKAEEEKITALRAKLARKDEVLAELMEEHVALKKALGAI
jgi:transposase-like protein